MAKSDIGRGQYIPAKDTHNKETHIEVNHSAFSFEQIWQRYPCKVGKKEAERHFKSSIKTEEDWENINKALVNYLKSDRVSKGYIQNGSTWSNWLF